MILLDTHAWVWWCSGSPQLTSRAAKAIRAEDDIGVVSMSCWEVGMLVAKKRLVLDRNVETWVDQALKVPKVRLLQLTPRIALKSTMLGDGFHGDPVDRIIVSTALEYGIPVVSKDRRISEFPGLKVIW
jgi:PIN domain nuclease of toxin-antitoxin system